MDFADLVHALKRVLREPLLHFALSGVLLFWLYGAVSLADSAEVGEIVVTRGQIESLAAGFERSWQRPPSDSELQGLIDGWVRDEVLYREGLALGLERDDIVVRKRVAQKFELLSEEPAAAAVPSDSELQAWLDAHAAQYRRPPVISFEQVYFDPARRGKSLERDVARARRDPSAAGDSTMLPARLEGASPAEIASSFGPRFAEALESVLPDAWAGPIASSYGVHLVRVTARVAGGAPALDDVREAVARDWSSARMRAAKDALYRKLRERYQVTVEPNALAAR